MPATRPPASRQHFQHSEEVPESEVDSPLTSLSPYTQYPDSLMTVALRSEAGYKDTITLAPLAGANIAPGEPTGAGSALTKISWVFAARSDNKPQSDTEAMADSMKWHVAIKSELDSHTENGTWEVGKLPPGRCESSSKWVFKKKVNSDGSLYYMPAQLVVCGFKQRKGLDYQETFALVAKFSTSRVLLALATYFDWVIHHMDVNTAFLYPELEEIVYMTPLEGCDEFQPDHKPIPKMLKLLKCLYGLK